MTVRTCARVGRIITRPILVAKTSTKSIMAIRRFTNDQARDIKSVLNPNNYIAMSRLLGVNSKTTYSILYGMTYADIDVNARYPRTSVAKTGTRGVRAFSDQDVRDIRQVANMSTYQQVARLLQVDSKTVYNVVNGTTYRDVR